MHPVGLAGAHRLLMAVMAVTAIFALLPQGGWPHGFAGKRFFPTMLIVS